MRSQCECEANVNKWEVVLHISETWFANQSGDEQSTCQHSYIFILHYAQCIAHFQKKSHTYLLLDITSMPSNLCTNLHIFFCIMSHLHIHEYTCTLTLCFIQSHLKFANMLASSSTHLDISLMLCIFTFHICTFVDTLAYCIHKHRNAFDHWIHVCNIKCNHHFFLQMSKNS